MSTPKKPEGENEDDNTGPITRDPAKLLEQAEKAINKADSDALLAKLKNKLAEKKKLQQSLAICDAEINKMLDDYKRGLPVA
jgi:mevalonate kinase